MLRELIAIFRGEKPGELLVQNMDRMIQESAELVRLAGDVYFQRAPETPAIEDLKTRDKGVNELQRQLRKDAFDEALVESRHYSLPFCFSVMNVAKDLERLADYAKELAELAEVAGPAKMSDTFDAIPEVEQFVELLSSTMKEGDQVKAVHMIERGKKLRRKLSRIQQGFLTDSQHSSHNAADTLALHYYMRIISHTLNVLSTLVTPLDRMDYLDKKHMLPEVQEKLQELDSSA